MRTRRGVLAGAGASGLIVQAAAAHGPRPPNAGEIRRLYVDSPWGQTHAYAAGRPGGARPALVAFHLTPDSGVFFASLQRAMASDRFVICPDTPGYGGSDGPPAPVEIADYARALTGVIDGFQLKTVDLLGFHTGALLAAEMAIQRPALVRRLVLAGVPLFPAEERARRRAEAPGRRPYFSEPDLMGRLWGDQGLTPRFGAGPDRALTLFAEQLRAGRRFWYASDAVMRYDAEGRLPQVTQPVLLPVLDEMLAANTRAAAGLFTDAAVVERPDLKDDAFENRADDLAALLRSFLDG